MNRTYQTNRTHRSRTTTAALFVGALLGAIIVLEGQAQLSTATGTYITNANTAAQYAGVVSAVGVPAVEGRQARLTYANLTTDSVTNGYLVVWKAATNPPVTITNAWPTGSTNAGAIGLPQYAANSLYSNAVLVLQSTKYGLTQRLSVFSNTPSLFMFNERFNFPVSAGDKLQLMTEELRMRASDTTASTNVIDQQHIVNFPTKDINVPGGFWLGQPEKPVLVEARGNGSGPVRLHFLAWDYMKP